MTFDKMVAALEAFCPHDEQERADQSLILALCAKEGEAILTRECRIAHMTASAIILSPDRLQTLMVFHNIYQSWSWTGGHADGEVDLYAVALTEAMEETGIRHLEPLDARHSIAAVDILPVWGHVKRGAYVSSHLHLNVTYIFTADTAQPIAHKADENSDVRWLPVNHLSDYVTEEQMLPIYQRFINRANSAIHHA